MWDAQSLLDFTQDLLLEPPRAYYNISSRLRLLNQAQAEMARLTRAVPADARYLINAGQASYLLPDSYGTLGVTKPRFVTRDGRVHELKVRSTTQMEDAVPGWAEARNPGTPEYLVKRGRTLYLHPMPKEVGELVLFFHIRPPDMIKSEDQPFAGDPELNEFADGLAYKAASMIIMPRSLELGGNYLSLFERRVREMRHALRNYAQHERRIRPYTYKERDYESR